MGFAPLCASQLVKHTLLVSWPTDKELFRKTFEAMFDKAKARQVYENVQAGSGNPLDDKHFNDVVLQNAHLKLQLQEVHARQVYDNVHAPLDDADFDEVLLRNGDLKLQLQEVHKVEQAAK